MTLRTRCLLLLVVVTFLTGCSVAPGPVLSSPETEILTPLPSSTLRSHHGAQCARHATAHPRAGGKASPGTNGDPFTTRHSLASANAHYPPAAGRSFGPPFPGQPLRLLRRRVTT